MGAPAIKARTTLRAVRDGARAEAAALRSRPAPLHTPRLVVVPRRRRTARLAALGLAIVFLLMLGVVAFQTELAQNQLDLDRTVQQLDLERARTRELRRDNAALRSPDRIAAAAAAIGMVATSTRDFLVIPQEVVDLVNLSAGDALDDVVTRRTDPFRDYQETKALINGEEP